MDSRCLRFLMACLAAVALSCGGGGGIAPGTDTIGSDTVADAATGETETTTPACRDDCMDETLRECVAGGVRVCADTDDDGCLEWSDPVACGEGETCVAGACKASCPDQQCTAIGAKKCQDNTTVVSCGDYDGDQCLEWGDPQACGGGLVCSNGFCATSCSNGCTAIGAKKCEMNDVVVCGDYNADGCLEWGDPQSCGALACVGGFCKQNCSDQCATPGAKKCDGNGVTTCDDHDANGCLEWGTVVGCEPGQTCANGFCYEQCVPECTVPGARKCDLNAVASCGDLNADGCLEWGTPVPCDEGLVCNNGYCEQQCKNECTVLKSKACDEAGNVVVCEDPDGDGCLKWGVGVPCEQPYICNGGNCALFCNDECATKNEKQCVTGSTTQYKVCDDHDADGCLEWGSGVECDAGLVCSGGACAQSCTNECAVSGDRKCEAGGYRTCGDLNADGCLEWGDTVNCGAGQTCTNGFCVATCTGECTVAGARKCDGNGYLTCGDANNDGCLEWGGKTSCGAQVCSSGYCQDACASECTQSGARKCDGAGYAVCDDLNLDGCLEWGPVTACTDGQTCSNGFCQDQCANECTVIGGKKCDINAVATCGDYNGDLCLEWGTPVPCADNLVCSSGVCELQCKAECTVVNAKKCDAGGNVVACLDPNADGCLKWGNPVPCAAPYVCSNGNCALLCSDECPAKAAKRCVEGTTNQYQVCDEYDADGCLEWGSGQACGGTLVCSAGVCVATCTDECSPADVKQCDGNGFRTCGDYNADGCLEWGTLSACLDTQECKAGACADLPAPAKVVISELLYDSSGTPDKDAFVELFGPAGLDLTGYSVVGVNGFDGKDYQAVSLAGYKIPADGYFLIANTTAAASILAAADLKTGNVDYQNGPDNVHVRFGKVVVDAIGYGTFGAGEFFLGESTSVPKVAAGHSLSRDDKNTDSDNNAVDFRDAATPTPGAVNGAVNVKPVGSLACPASANIGDPVTFDGSGSSDSDGTITNWAFDFGDGSAAVSGADDVVAHTYAKIGAFSATLTVTDDKGATAQATCSVTIVDVVKPTVVFIKPSDNTQVTQGQVVPALVDATASGGRTIAKVELFADGTTTGLTDTQAPYEFAWTVPTAAATGSTVQLQAKATDSAGAVGASSIVKLLVENDAPVASFTAVVSGTKTVSMDASACTDTETAQADLQVRWDYQNDGTWDSDWSTTKTAEYVYPADGKYTIKMEVKDAIGQVSAATREITLSSIQYVSGNVTTTQWTGTIVITGDVVVPTGNTLRISGGTSVLFAYSDQNTDGVGDWDITVNGTLIVDGTDSAPVLFTAGTSTHKHAKAWNRVRINGAGSVITGAIFEYAHTALELQNGVTLIDVVVRKSTTGIEATNGTSEWDNVTLTENENNGVQFMGPAVVTATSCKFDKNGWSGAVLMASNAKLNLSLSQVTNNGRTGLEFGGKSGGTITKNLISKNGWEGLRLWTADGDPNPVVNYNNLYGNALTSARVVTTVGIQASATGNSGTITSPAWSTPGAEPVEWIFVNYTDSDSGSYNYVSGSVRKDGSGGSQLYSTSVKASGWKESAVSNASTIVAQAVDGWSGRTGSMQVTKAAYQKTGAVREVSALLANTTGALDLRHNYFGAFPKVGEVLSIGTTNSVNVQGFTGVPFDSTWSTGPYFGGESLPADTTWLGEVFVTGNVSVPSGAKLTVNAGTTVQFACFDANEDGRGDCGVTSSSGILAINGTSAAPVLFTAFGTAKAPRAWDTLRATGGTLNAQYATIEYADDGLTVDAASGTVDHVTLRNNADDGLVVTSVVTGTQLLFSNVTSEMNGMDGLSLMQSDAGVFDRLTLQDNAANGMTVSSVKGVTIKNSTIQRNALAGASMQNTAVAFDHDNFLYNQYGVRWYGASTNYLGGSVTYSNIKYNKREGIMVYSSQASGSATPVINNCNIYGNSVTDAGDYAANPGVSASATGNSGTVTSAAWTTPNGAIIQFVRVNYTDSDSGSYNYVSGSIRKDGASGSQIYSTSTKANLFVEMSAQSAKTIVAQVVDGWSGRTGTMTVQGAFFYRTPTDTFKKEVAVLTDGGTVDAKANYWGVDPLEGDPLSRFSLGRTDAINFQGFVGTEVNGCGPL